MNWSMLQMTNTSKWISTCRDWGSVPPRRWSQGQDSDCIM